VLLREVVEPADAVKDRDGQAFEGMLTAGVWIQRVATDLSAQQAVKPGRAFADGLEAGIP
jgi:hypothetical protein